MRARKKLGEILVEGGLLTRKQLEETLPLQKHGQGCLNCMHTGYKGRSDIYEVLLITDFVKDLILKNASAHDIARAAAKAGEYSTLKDSAAEKVIQGITSLEEAASAVMV